MFNNSNTVTPVQESLATEGDLAEVLFVRLNAFTGKSKSMGLHAPTQIVSAKLQGTSQVTDTLARLPKTLGASGSTEKVAPDVAARLGSITLAAAHTAATTARLPTRGMTVQRSARLTVSNTKQQQRQQQNNADAFHFVGGKKTKTKPCRLFRWSTYMSGHCK